MIGVVISLLVSIFANAGDPKTEPVIQSGQCYSNLMKEYLTNSTATSGQVQFRCSYFCLTPSGSKQLVKADSAADAAEAARDGSKMVCDGVVTKSRFVGANLIWDFDHVDAFWAVESSKPEILDWALKNKADLSPSEFELRMAKFRTAMQNLSLAYSNVSAEEFKSAAKQLTEISKNTFTGRAILKEHLEKLLQMHNSKTQLGNELSPSNLVSRSILANGRFLIGMKTIGSTQLEQVTSLKNLNKKVKLKSLAK